MSNEQKPATQQTAGDVANKMYPPAAPAAPVEPSAPAAPAEPTPPAAAAPPAEPAKKVEEKPVEPVKEEPAKPAEPPAAPEKYELKLPDGSKLDAAAVEKVSSFAKENKLSNDQAQAILNRESDAVSSFSEAQQNALKERREVWKNESMNDKEIGGDNFPKNVELAHRALKHFGGDDLLQELEVTGYGNHPAVVRAFARIGKAMSEDKLVTAPGQVGNKKSLAETFYPNQTKK